MITQTENNQINISGNQKSINSGINAEDLSHIFNVLRNQLYSRKIEAFIREYSTNAIDAHNLVNKKERFRVTLPNIENPVFKVRDFGPGLSFNDIEQIYTKYGASTKRLDNVGIGQLGFGSKSAWAYTDSFTIISYHNGKKTTYLSYIDETSLGKTDLINEEDTDETGIEIIIPIDIKDIDEVVRTAFKVYYYFEPKPNLVLTKSQQDIFVELESKIKINFENGWWRIRGSDQTNSSPLPMTAMAIMGSIAYPIDVGMFSNIPEEFSSFLRIPLEIKFPIGKLAIAPSREALSYNKNTINAINQSLKTIAKSFIEHLYKDIDSCPNLNEARRYIVEQKSKLWSSFPYQRNIRSIAEKATYTLKYKGNLIPWSLSYEELHEITGYTKIQAIKTTEKTWTETIHYDPLDQSKRKYVLLDFYQSKSIFLIDDVPSERLKRSINVVHNYDYNKVFLIQTNKDLNEIDFTNTALEGIEIKRLSDFNFDKDKLPVDIQLSNERKTKIGKNFFKCKKQNVYTNAASDNWSICTEIEEDKECYWAEINRYIPIITVDGFENLYYRTFYQLINYIRVYNGRPEIENIYGIKSSYLKKKSAPEAWVNINDLFKKEIKEYFKKRWQSELKIKPTIMSISLLNEVFSYFSINKESTGFSSKLIKDIYLNEEDSFLNTLKEIRLNDEFFVFTSDFRRFVAIEEKNKEKCFPHDPYQIFDKENLVKVADTKVNDSLYNIINSFRADYQSELGLLSKNHNMFRINGVNCKRLFYECLQDEIISLLKEKFTPIIETIYSIDKEYPLFIYLFNKTLGKDESKLLYYIDLENEQKKEVIYDNS